MLTDVEKEKLVASGGNDSGVGGEEMEDEHDSTELDPLIEEPPQQKMGGEMDADDASNGRVDEQGPMERQKDVEDASHGARSHSEEAEREGDGRHTSADSASALAASLNSPRFAVKSKKLNSFLHMVS